MTERIILDPKGIRSDHLGHRVIIGWNIYGDNNPADMQRFEIILTPAAAAHLAATLTQNAVDAMAQQLDDTVRGECATCHNVRMVDVVQAHGGTMVEHCPDCNPDTDRVVPEVIPAEYTDAIAAGKITDR